MASLYRRLLLLQNPNPSLLPSLSISCYFSSIASVFADPSSPSSSPSSSDAAADASGDNSNTSSSSSPSPKEHYMSFVFEEKDLDEFVKKFKRASNSYRFRSRKQAYEIAVHRLVSAGRPDSVHEILHRQRRFPDIRREGFATRLIRLYGKANLFPHARQLFDDLPLLRCPRTALSLNALLTAALSSKLFSTVPDLLSTLPSQISVAPDRFSYNILVHALCKIGSLDEALSILDDEMRSDESLSPDLVTFNSLLNALYAAGDRSSDADRIWVEMERAGFEPNILSYNARLRGFVSQGKTKDVLELIEELKSRGPKPDTLSFNALMKAYCVGGDLEAAIRTFKELGANGCAPNRWTYETLIPHLAEEGQLDFAVKLCNESIVRKSPVDVGIVQGIVDSLVRESKKDEADKLIETATAKYRLNYSSLKLAE